MSKTAAVLRGLVLLPVVLAQQFPLRTTSYEHFGLSEKCFEALNTTLECSSQLVSHVRSESTRVDVLDADGIDAICNDGCKKSLAELRAKIQSDCNPKIDVFDHGLMIYPDRYIYVYDISCYKNRDTRNPCDYILGEWRNQTDDSPRECDDCVLGPMEIEVNSPIGHTESRAVEFQSVISSCGATGYTYTSPLPYAISSTVAPPDLSASPTIGAQSWSAQRMSADCATTYHVQDGDTCDSISIAQSVSSRDLVEANEHLDNWCGGLGAGQEMCLPAQCKLHLLTTEDSCESLLRQYGVSPKDLSEWNPKLYIQCDGFSQINTGYICVGPPIIPKKSPETSPAPGKSNSTINISASSPAATSTTVHQTAVLPLKESSTTQASMDENVSSGGPIGETTGVFLSD
ncbi:LysM domain-containing protein [Colletotrichum cuscutae]|uniref:LysM domain-containing protein n=1 Tax=Colletotrichum cuscutae TaxID=1209917 RepID=A0AAI9TVS8_9PEZI|nr:LysM domain-containing protein [Colletotrichum cuscutae]